MGLSRNFVSFIHSHLSLAGIKDRRQRRAARKDYESRFDEHRIANEKRVRHMSQLRGDEDPSAYLYDSVYGTGAFSASRRSVDRQNVAPDSVQAGPRRMSIASDENTVANWAASRRPRSYYDPSQVPRVPALPGVSTDHLASTSTGSSARSGTLGSLSGSSIGASTLTLGVTPPDHDGLQDMVQQGGRRRRVRPMSMPEGSFTGWVSSPKYGRYVEVWHGPEPHRNREMRLDAFAA